MARSSNSEISERLDKLEVELWEDTRDTRGLDQCPSTVTEIERSSFLETDWESTMCIKRIRLADLRYGLPLAVGSNYVDVSFILPGFRRTVTLQPIPVVRGEVQGFQVRYTNRGGLSEATCKVKGSAVVLLAKLIIQR
jgi:hypothetical protein